MTHPPTILRDTAEKQPYKLLDASLVRYEPRRLLFGDYALESQCVRAFAETWVPRFAVERKSVRDWIASWHGKTKANGYSAGHAERRKMVAAKAYSKTLGYQCRFHYVLDGMETDIMNALRGHPWKSKGLTLDAVTDKMNEIRISGYHVILCAHKLHAERTTRSLLLAHEAKYGPAPGWEGQPNE